MNSCPHPRPPPQGKRSRKDAIRAKGAHSLWIPCLPLGGQERHRLPYVASGGVQSSSRGLLAIRDHGVHLEVPGLHLPKPWIGWLGSPLWLGVCGSILRGTPCLLTSPLPNTHGCWRVSDSHLLGKEKAKFCGQHQAAHTMWTDWQNFCKWNNWYSQSGWEQAPTPHWL